MQFSAHAEEEYSIGIEAQVWNTPSSAVTCLVVPPNSSSIITISDDDPPVMPVLQPFVQPFCVDAPTLVQQPLPTLQSIYNDIARIGDLHMYPHPTQTPDVSPTNAIAFLVIPELSVEDIEIFLC